MEPIFLVIVGILMLLAISDLIVGVSNDAVNFLNSAVGSRAASRKVIMIIASIGIMAGVLTSSGMMEVARSGVFYPQMFSFSNIMMLFLAVMLTDVLLLDLFNTLGIPTSTTVSLIFELLGAAVCVSIFAIVKSDVYTLSQMHLFINSGKAMVIITGILSSVVVAFVCGSFIMYITRLLFTFNFHKKIKSLGVIWCGIALTAITYFALFKGLKGASFIPIELMQSIDGNILFYTILTFIFWCVIMFFVTFTRFNILKITVLAGTFALALAFAGNDLVNFIGVFMAGFDSYNLAQNSGDINMAMTGLLEPVKANLFVLIASGGVMVLTLWFSKKAKRVTETEINLSKEDESYEKFGSTSISRSIVRGSVNIARYIDDYTPSFVKDFVNSRFEPVVSIKRANEPAFDLIRATVNLTVAALLISLATSLKLPLSTTYVTFMVAMGTSIADRAWGRENAVYKITGVLTVISGWFLTGVLAFLIAFVVAALLMVGKTIAIIVLTFLCGYILYKSNLNKKSENRIEKKEESIINICVDKISRTTKLIPSLYSDALEGVFVEDRKSLKEVFSKSDELYRLASERKHNIINTINSLKDNYLETGYYYVQAVDYLCEVTKSLRIIAKLSYEHINNNHKGLSNEQVEDLKLINHKMNEIFALTNNMLDANDYSNIENVISLGDDFFDTITLSIKNQIKRNVGKVNTTRSSILYFNILTEAKTIILQLRNLLKAQKHFITSSSYNS